MGSMGRIYTLYERRPYPPDLLCLPVDTYCFMFNESQRVLVAIRMTHRVVQDLRPEDIDDTVYPLRGDESPLDDELERTIRAMGGNIVPVLVQRRADGSLALIDGHRRVAAIRAANHRLPEEHQIRVTAEILDIDDTTAAMMAFLANSNRGEIHPRDMHIWVYRLLSEYGVPRSRIMRDLGLAESTVSNIVRAFEKTIPEVRQRLFAREMTVSDAKVFAGLCEEDQYRLLDIYDRGGRTRQHLFVLAQDLQERRLAEQAVREALRQIDINEIALTRESVDTLCTQVLSIAMRFGQWRRVRPSRGMVLRALHELGVRIERRKRVRTGAGHPRETPRMVSCGECGAMSKAGVCAIHGAMRHEPCDMFLRGQHPSDVILRCPFCGGLTIFPVDGVDHMVVTPEEVLPINLQHDHLAHTQCVIDALARTGRIRGECENCQNGACVILHTILRRPFTQVTVDLCEAEFVPRGGMTRTEIVEEAMNLYLQRIHDILATSH